MTIFIFKLPIQPIYIIYSLHNPILLSVLQISISCISCIDFSKFYCTVKFFHKRKPPSNPGSDIHCTAHIYVCIHI